MPVLSTLGAAAARGFGFLGKVAQAIDEYFEYVTMLLPGNGTNGAQNNTFLDSSTNNFSITRNGSTAQGTFAPYGANWSNYFNGPSSGTYFETPTNTAFQLGTSDFTIEFWVFITSGASETCVCRTDTGGSAQNGMLLGYSDGTNILWYATSNGSTWNIISGGVLCSVASVKNTWAHFAYVRSGSTFTAYVNGTQAYTTTSSAAINQVTNGFRIGTANTGTGLTNFGGYISNFRYVKGSAVYTANFTPSTTPLTAITNTSLLTCQSNRFIDNSANNFTITRNGDVSVQVFSPFSPTSPYAAGTNGGSGYFDGSGDYLQAPNNAAFAFGTGNFTLEAWFYVVPPLGNNTILGNLESSSDADTVLGFWLTGTGGIEIATWNTFLYQSASNVVVSNQWNHIAICRSGTTDAVWLNGTRLSSWTDTFNYSATNGYRVGAWGSGSYIYKGYISNARIIKGSAVYNPSSTTITVPTSPFSSISGTSLLCNFTNAGVIDNAMMNNLETVGNAQISTTQSKWGGSSIAFDGTGDWLLAPSSPNLALLTGNFTIEMWVYFNNTTQHVFFDMRGIGTAAPNNPVLFWSNSASKIQAYINDDFRITSGTLNTAQWYHVALTRSGTTVTLYVDGVSQGTYTYSASITQQALYVGTGSGLGSFNGYIDDLRITKGFARYTANFTAPTAPFPTR